MNPARRGPAVIGWVITGISMVIHNKSSTYGTCRYRYVTREPLLENVPAAVRRADFPPPIVPLPLSGVEGAEFRAPVFIEPRHSKYPIIRYLGFG